ncbi:hypothetical protein V8E53_001279 [Lactarius tabidus]
MRRFTLRYSIPYRVLVFELPLVDLLCHSTLPRSGTHMNNTMMDTCVHFSPEQIPRRCKVCCKTTRRYAHWIVVARIDAERVHREDGSLCGRILSHSYRPVNRRSCAERGLCIRPVRKEARCPGIAPQRHLQQRNWLLGVHNTNGAWVGPDNSEQRVAGGSTRSILYAPSKSTSHQFRWQICVSDYAGSAKMHIKSLRTNGKEVNERIIQTLSDCIRRRT